MINSPFAARRMSFVTFAGCEIQEAWGESMAVACASARLAMNRCAAALMAFTSLTSFGASVIAAPP